MKRWLNTTRGHCQQAVRKGAQVSYGRIQSSHRVSVAFGDDDAALDLPLIVQTQKLSFVYDWERGIHVLEECSYEIMLVLLRR